MTTIGGIKFDVLKNSESKFAFLSDGTMISTMYFLMKKVGTSGNLEKFYICPMDVITHKQGGTEYKFGSPVLYVGDNKKAVQYFMKKYSTKNKQEKKECLI